MSGVTRPVPRGARCTRAPYCQVPPATKKKIEQVAITRIYILGSTMTPDPFPGGRL